MFSLLTSSFVACVLLRVMLNDAERDKRHAEKVRISILVNEASQRFGEAFAKVAARFDSEDEARRYLEGVERHAFCVAYHEPIALQGGAVAPGVPDFSWIRNSGVRCDEIPRVIGAGSVQLLYGVETRGGFAEWSRRLRVLKTLGRGGENAHRVVGVVGFTRSTGPK